MLEITHIIEPLRLWLTWQPTTGGTRYLIGHIDRLSDGSFEFEYHKNSSSFEKAQEKGFVGHPAFKTKFSKHSNNVLAPFLRRLPPRSRGDFKNYLAQHLLKFPFSGSDFALLGYTGAKSPGDGFSLVPDFSGADKDIDYQLEVAGTRYITNLKLDNIHVGDVVSLEQEPSNMYDSNAIAIIHNNVRIGFVNKVLCGYIAEKLLEGSISAVISRKNGTSDRPLIYVFITIRRA